MTRGWGKLNPSHAYGAGPIPALLPQAARCNSPLDCMPGRSRPYAGVREMPVPHSNPFLR